MIALPGYVDKDAWEGFTDMRKAIKKPLTVRAAKLILYELQRIKNAGHCPNAALDQSTVHNWADVYEPKDKAITHKSTSDADKHREWLDQQERDRQQRADPARVAAVVSELKQRMRA